MLISYNKEKIIGFLKDIYNATGLTASIWDTDINCLGVQPQDMTNFCRFIRTSPLGRERCMISDKAVCSSCKKTLQPTSHICHAGLADTSIPLMLNGNLFGFMMFGQVHDIQQAPLSYEHFQKLGAELSLNPDSLFEYYKKLEPFDMEKIKSTVKIFSYAMGYLFDSSAVNYTENELVNYIDDYIKTNITKQIYVPEICEYFGISRTRLYSISNTYYKMPIGKYIMKNRLEKAKNLLLSSKEQIHIISEKVGISDYNYFTKLFKNHFGMPPMDYRKHNS